MSSPARPRRTALAVAALAACACAGLPGSAAATQIVGDLEHFAVSDTGFAGLPATNGPDVYAVDVATVAGQSVWRLTTESPIRAVDGTCVRISGTDNVAGPSEIHCRRGPAPAESLAILGRGDDRFVAAPGFPDRLRLVGEDGNDTLTGGAANDVINGGEGDNVLTGNEGDDNVSLGNPVRSQFADIPNGTNRIEGGPGNDTLAGLDGPDTIHGGDGNDLLNGGRDVDVLEGENGDDSLNSQEDAFARRDHSAGGPGTDRFFADVVDQVFARDGLPEQIACAPVRFAFDPLAFVETDLKDSISRTEPCPTVLDAPVNQKPTAIVASPTVRVAGRTARILVRCTTQNDACQGTLRFRLDRTGARRASRTFFVRGGRTTSARIAISRRDAARVTRKGVRATVQLTETTKLGEQGVQRAVLVKR